jgi:SAM-dependent methyltransferase
MHPSAAVFVAKELDKEDIKGKSILEIGSRNVNGTIRPYVESRDPRTYVGVDKEDGPSVDKIVDANNVVDEFGQESFDIVITTEMLEHINNWECVISNIKRVCKSGGLIVITTRSKGFEYHAYPDDYWRYEVPDMEILFSDCDIITLEPDPLEEGVFLKAAKPEFFKEVDLSGHSLYSILHDERVNTCPIGLEEEDIRELLDDEVEEDFNDQLKSGIYFILELPSRILIRIAKEINNRLIGI